MILALQGFLLKVFLLTFLCYFLMKILHLDHHLIEIMLLFQLRARLVHLNPHPIGIVPLLHIRLLLRNELMLFLILQLSLKETIQYSEALSKSVESILVKPMEKPLHKEYDISWYTIQHPTLLRRRSRI